MNTKEKISSEAKKKILIIDDSPTLRRLLRFYLKKRGYELDEANNGRMGLNFFQQNCYDLIITDIAMPVMDGIEFIENIRKTDSKIPILVLSVRCKDDDIKDLYASGLFNACLSMPNKPDTIMAKIEELLNSI